MQRLCLAIFFAAVAIAAQPVPDQPAPEYHLVSPWQAIAVNLTQVPYTCPLPSQIPATSQAVAAADAFRHTGSQAAARCVVALVGAAAANHALSETVATPAEAWVQTNALRAFAVAYLKVRDTGVASPDEQTVITAWMVGIAQKERALVDACPQKLCTAHGHHGLAIVLTAAIAAVIANDQDLFGWAISQYQGAVPQIDDRGLFQWDMHGATALKNSLYSAADLVQLADLGEINGVNLYAFDHGRVHTLVHAVTRGLVDPAPFAQATGSPQSMPKYLQPWEVSWAALYNRRFPDPGLSALLKQAGPKGADMWGGEPLFAGVS